MSRRRPTELEEYESLNSTKESKTSVDQLRTKQKELTAAFSQSHPERAPDEAALHILVVDDNFEFLSTLGRASEGLNLNIETLQPQTVDDTRDKILESDRRGQPFDCVLLDYQYSGQDFDGLNILETVRFETEDSPPGLPDKEKIKLRYLPVAIVTRGGSNGERVDGFDPDAALGAGADKVYSAKGFDQENGLSDSQNQSDLTAEPLLRSLRTGGFKEMRYRAWARLWQDLRDRIEERIKQQLDEKKWLGDQAIVRALEKIWEILAEPIIESGYASHICIRTLLYSHEEKTWQLKKIGSTDQAERCPAIIDWNAVPIHRTCLTEPSQKVHLHETLTKEDLIDGLYQNDGEVGKFRAHLGRRAMHARLDSRLSRVGTVLMTRKSDLPKFSREDRTNFRIIVERLGLFYRELSMRQRNHDRQIALVELGEKLIKEESENKIVEEAVRVLHKHLHEMRSVFREKPSDNPALNGRVSIRLIEPGTGRLMRPDQYSNRNSDHNPEWALGFDTADHSPAKITVDSDRRYKDLIEKGDSLFFPNPELKEVERRRQTKTHAKMLAPIKAGTVIVGTVNVEHKEPCFYGKSEEASADFALLKAVALEVGQSLSALRALRMLKKLIQLHDSTGKKDQNEVISKLIEILYDYNGCAVGVWLEPDGEGWKLKRVWECPQGYRKDEPAPLHFQKNHKKDTLRLVKWQSHIEDDYDQTFIAQSINKDERDKHSQEKPASRLYYKPMNPDRDAAMNVKTRSQAVLILRDPTTAKTMGAFSFLFNQYPGLDVERQEPLLIEAANFAASYLLLRQQKTDLLTNSIIMQQQADLGFAYQQLRHALITPLGRLNGTLDCFIDDLAKKAIEADKIKSALDQIKGLIAHLVDDIDISKVMMKPSNHEKLDVKVLWNQAVEKIQSSGISSMIDIQPMDESVLIQGDSEIVQMVFHNLISNSIEAMSSQDGPRIIRCNRYSRSEPGFQSIAVSDNGPGVPRDIADKLFEKIGISSKATGTGFGSYFSAYMLKRSGASIRIDRNYSDGARFIITFQPLNHKRS